jgi:hypothetical protein
MKSNTALGWHKRYDNIDGTGEMLMGMMMLGFGLLGYLQSILPKDSIWRTNFFLSLLFMYGVLFLAVGPGYLIRWAIKRRITFPRTGYVALGVGPHYTSAGGGDLRAKVKKSYWALMVISGGIAAAVAVGVVYLVAIQIRHVSSMMWLVGVGYVGYLGLWVLLYAFWIWRMGREHRWKWLMLLVMALGLLVIGIFGPGNYVEVARPVMLFVGTVWVFSGLATFCSYLRHTKPTTPETE